MPDDFDPNDQWAATIDEAQREYALKHLPCRSRLPAGFEDVSHVNQAWNEETERGEV